MVGGGGMTFWCIVLTIGFIVQGAYIRRLEKEIEAIESWYPLCEIMKMRIPKNKGGDSE
jgi:hypothetical protein